MDASEHLEYDTARLQKLRKFRDLRIIVPARGIGNSRTLSVSTASNLKSYTITMGNLKPLPTFGAREKRVTKSVPAPEPSKDVAPATGMGPRRLVRPVMPDNAGNHRAVRREPSPMLMHQMAHDAPSAWHDASHAEAFYFQKQMQSQTLMVFVLEDGECVEGCIEWYDRNAIKVRNSSRTLIYKSSIKYLYKANEAQS
jgi:sRNA-binding regulator protein Hfq